MKLIRLSIENFGKLQNQDFTFQDGCNVFCHENGWGKSTLAAFLKVMLYGFENERSRDEYSNERKRFRPWQGGVYGGSLTFEACGKVYTATRTFGLKEKEDTFILREEATNIISRDFSTHLGQELFHIDRASFERTVFLSQNDCGTKATDQIHAKIGNLTEAMDDMNHYEKADGKLNDLLNSMSPVRKTGSLYRLKEQISELEAEVRTGDRLDAAMENLLNEKREIREEYDSLKKTQLELTEKQRKASIYKDLQAKREKYSLLQNRCQQKTKEAEEHRKTFVGAIPKAEELDIKISQCISLAAEENTVRIYRLSETEQKNLEKWETLFSEGMPEEEDSLRGEQSGNNKKKTTLYIVLLIWGIMTAIFGSVLLYQKVPVGIILVGAGLAMIIIGMIQNQKHQISKEYEDVLLENQRYEMKKSFSEYEKLKEKKDFYENACSAYEKMKETLDSYIRNLGFVPEPMLQRQLLELKSRLEGYEIARREEERAREEKELFEKMEDMDRIREMDIPDQHVSMEETEERLRRIQKKTETYHRKVLQIEQQIQEQMEKREELCLKEEQLTSLIEQYYKDTAKYQRLKMTREYLSRAKSSFTAKYRNPLMKAFAGYYEMLSTEKADTCCLDGNINLTVQELGNQREARYFSAGWKDLMGICMRMALVDAMYREEKPFLIMDDPFVNLDAQKTEAGMEFIRKISGEYQILYFTCHESRTVNDR